MKTIRTVLTLVCALAMTAASAAEPLSNSEVDARWRKTAIKVAGGGAAPNVVTLLKAFHQALPTWVVGEVLDQNDHPAKGTRRNGSTLILESDEEIGPDRWQSYSDILNRLLCEAHDSYRKKIEQKIMLPLEVRFVQPQTFALYRDMKILDGASPNQIKPIHVISNEKLKRFFFALLQR